MAKNILKFNNIAESGLGHLHDYNVLEEHADPDAIILRSYKLHDHEFGSNLLAVGRAGAGVNNIPVDKLSNLGVAVFNTPGANANAVKELVLSGMLLASRNLFPAYDFVKTLSGDTETLNKSVEENKKQFSGSELQGKTLGVIGLGSIGVMVANTAIDLGMNVIGYDPAITIQNAWRLSSQVVQAPDVNMIYANSHFLSFHVPLNEHTKNMFSTEQLAYVKEGITLLNFSRFGIVDSAAIVEGIKSGKIKNYCTDFPESNFADLPGVITLPHLGASTKEAEENCAEMVCLQVKDYLENGNVNNSVNLPNLSHPRSPDSTRLSIINKNIPNMLAEVSGKLGASNLNILNMHNESRGDLAYTMVDVESEVNDAIVQDLATIQGFVKVRKIS